MDQRPAFLSLLPVTTSRLIKAVDAIAFTSGVALLSKHPPAQNQTRPSRSEKALDAIGTPCAEWEGSLSVESREGSPARRSETGRVAVERSPGHPERRRTPRGVPGFEPHRAQLVSTTLGSYQEMPGLSLFVHQAARLFGVSIRTCQLVLDDLVKDKRLRRDARGQYVR